MPRTVETDSPMKSGHRISRIMWPIGWVLLLITTATVVYVLLVVGGK